MNEQTLGPSNRSNYQGQLPSQKVSRNGQRALSPMRYSWPIAVKSSSFSFGSEDNNVEGSNELLSIHGSQTEFQLSDIASDDKQPQLLKNGSLQAFEQFVSPIILCKRCRKLSNKDSLKNISNEGNYRVLTSYSDFNSKSTLYHCSRCGSIVTISADSRVLPRSKTTLSKGKLRRRLSKIHKSLRSSLRATPEVSESAEENGVVENQSTTTSKCVTSSHSRSTSGASRQPSNYGSDVEGCDITEYSDSNGKYIVIERRPSNNNGIANHLLKPSANKEIPVSKFEPVWSHDTPLCTPLCTPVSEQGLLVNHDNLSTSSSPCLTGDTQRTSTSSKTASTHSTNSSPTRRHNSNASRSSIHSYNLSNNKHQGSSLRAYSTAPNLGNLASASVSESTILYRPDAGTLFLPIPETNRATVEKQRSMRKKKRSPSWYNVLSPSYRQKNDDFHKFFKTLPDPERLLVDCTCALMKDILVQGRMYVSQNFVCFRSNILKWETVVTIPFKDVEAISKVKTAKVIPNAIQFQVKGRDKPQTFTSFTQRDRSYRLIHKLWQNALVDKPMTPQELWKSVHRQYGSDLGCSSDEDYVRPVTDSADGDFRSGEKVKRKKKPSKSGSGKNKSDGHSSHNAGTPETQNKDDRWSEEKSLCRVSIDDPFEEQSGNEEDDTSCDLSQSNLDDGPASHVKEDLKRVYMTREFNVSAVKMFDTIYGENCSFWNDYHVGKGSYDVIINKWQDGDGEHNSHRTRRLDYNLSLNNPLGPKSSRVDEIQVLYNESEPGQSYAVDCTARTLGVPYSDYFSTVMRHCIRKLTNSTCELRITADVKFHKNPWGMVKSFIEKNVHSGMVENFQLLERELDKYFHLEKSRNSSIQENVSRLRDSASTGPIRRRSPDSSATNDVARLQQYKNNPMPNGHVPQLAELTQTEVTAAPTTSPLAAPTNLYDKQQHSNTAPYYTKNSKWYLRIAVLAFCILLWSNYTMYQRLNSLEAVHSRLSSSGIDLSTFDLNSAYIPETSDDVKISKTLLNLDRRLARLEGVVENQGVSSEERWHQVQFDVKSLHDSVNKILHKLDSKQKT